MKRQIDIYDTTLRDGAQMQSISFGLADKLKILQALDELGVAYVEGGWPGANPKDIDFFREAQKLRLQNTVLTAFGSTRRAQSKVQEDTILAALLRAETEVICIVSKSSSRQVERTLNTSLENNLLMLSESVAYLKANGRRVFVDAEHFFDGYALDSDYSHQFISTAIEAGAESIVLCDTNGATLPASVERIIKELVSQYGSQIAFGIHAHNDSDLAVALSLAAVEAGVTQVQGTINGYGERCGNANLISIIANLQLKYSGYICLAEDRLSKLTEISKRVAEIANMNPNAYQPFTGSSAFTHKGGLHASAMQRDQTSYEHIDPKSIGNTSKILVSEQSGLSNLIDWMSLHKIELLGDADTQKISARAILERIKDLEAQGYSYENASASLEIMLRKYLTELYAHEALPFEPYPRYFELIDSDIIIQHIQNTAAKLTLRIGGEEKTVTTSTTEGPAHALDSALRQALSTAYPEIHNFHLRDYKVRILDSHLGTAAITKVQLSTGFDPVGQQGSHSWDTIGVHANIIKATWDALVDSIEYGLYAQAVKPISHAQSSPNY